MSSAKKELPSTEPNIAAFGMFAPAMEYTIDAFQRGVLFWDVMRQRGNQYREHMAETAPNVLDYKAELIDILRDLEAIRGDFTAENRVQRLIEALLLAVQFLKIYIAYKN